MSLDLEKYLSRRRALFMAGAGIAAIGAGSVALKGSGASTLVGRINPDDIRKLDDNMYLVDGWVLSAADLEDIDASHAKPATLFSNLAKNVD